MVKRKQLPLKDAGAARVSSSQTSVQSRPLTSITTTVPLKGDKKKVLTNALKEIRYLQRSTHLLIPRAPFLRLVCILYFSLKSMVSIM